MKLKTGNREKSTKPKVDSLKKINKIDMLLAKLSKKNKGKRKTTKPKINKLDKPLGQAI